MTNKGWKYGCIIGCFLALGCKEATKNNSNELSYEPNTEMILFTNYYFLDPQFRRINFPYWWNDESIKNKEVKSLKLTKYIVSDTLKRIDEQLIFDFHPAGTLKEMTKMFFDQGIFFNRDIISFDTNAGLFKKVKLKQGFKQGKNGENPGYVTFDRYEEKVDDMLLFSAQPNKHPNQLFITNEKNQNVTYVDRLTQEYNQAYFHFGTIDRPTESFFQHDLVKRSGKVEYTYYQKDILKSIAVFFDHYTENKEFQYDAHGRYWRTVEQTLDTDSVVIDKVIYEVSYPNETTSLPSSITVKRQLNDSLQKTYKAIEFDWEM